MHVVVEEQIRAVCPQMKLAVVLCEVSGLGDADALWETMSDEEKRIVEKYELADLNKRPAIQATRNLYKILGKDPNRYRPSAEALSRRVLRGIPLYRIGVLVDVINLVSLRSGISIGGFDAGKIEGDCLVLGVGTAGEDFDAIGRGQLNIEGLPVYRDQAGGVGTPTSDNERTKITEQTTRLLVIFNSFSGPDGLLEAVDHFHDLMNRFAVLTDFRCSYI